MINTTELVTGTGAGVKFVVAARDVEELDVVATEDDAVVVGSNGEDVEITVDGVKRLVLVAASHVSRHPGTSGEHGNARTCHRGVGHLDDVALSNGMPLFKVPTRMAREVNIMIVADRRG